MNDVLKKKEKLLTTDIPNSCTSLSSAFGFNNGGCFYTIIENLNGIKNV